MSSRFSPDARSLFRLLKEVGFCCERTPVHFFRFVDVKSIFDKGYNCGHSELEFAREVRAAVNVHAEVKDGAVCTDTKGWHRAVLHPCVLTVVSMFPCTEGAVVV